MQSSPSLFEKKSQWTRDLMTGKNLDRHFFKKLRHELWGKDHDKPFCLLSSHEEREREHNLSHYCVGCCYIISVLLQFLMLSILLALKDVMYSPIHK